MKTEIHIETYWTVVGDNFFCYVQGCYRKASLPVECFKLTKKLARLMYLYHLTKTFYLLEFYLFIFLILVLNSYFLNKLLSQGR